MIDLDVLPPGHAVAAAVDRLLRMRRGEQVELQASLDLTAVWQDVSGFSPAGYQFTVVRGDLSRVWRNFATTVVGVAGLPTRRGGRASPGVRDHG